MRIKQLESIIVNLLLFTTIFANIPFASGADSEITVSPSSGAPGSIVKVSISNWKNPLLFPNAVYMQDAAGEYGVWNLHPVDPWTDWEVSGTTISRDYTIYFLAREGINLISLGGDTSAEFTVEKEAPPSVILDFTVSDPIELYPTSSTFTQIKLNYETDHVNVIEIEAIDTPDYLQVSFDKTGITPDSTGTGNVEMSIKYDPEKNPNTDYPQETSIKVKITSDGQSYSRNIKLNLLPAKWLIFFFIAVESKNSLQYYTMQDLAEIIITFYDFVEEKKGEDKEPNPIVLSILLDADHDEGYLKGGQAIWFITEEGLPERKTVLGNRNMGQVSTYNEFMEMILKKVPHEQSLLLLNGHGGGISGLMMEKNPKDIITLPEFKQIGTSFDLITMASCLMGQLEVHYDLRTKTDYIVASELSMQADALSYKEVLNFMFNAPDVTAKDLAIKFLDTYKYETLSLVDTTKLDELVKAVDMLGETLVIGFQSNDPEFMEGLRKSVLSTSYVRSGMPYIDLTDFSKELVKNMSKEEIKTAAQKVIEASNNAVIKNEVNRNVASFPKGDATTTEFHGLSIFFWEHTTSGEAKKMYNEIENAYKQSDFAKETKWLDFVKLYRSQGRDKTVTIRLTGDKKLSLHVKDKLGYHVGYNKDNPTWIAESTIPGALFMELENGDEMILLSGEIEDFETVIEGNLTQKAEYSLTYNLIEGENVLAEETISGVLDSYSNHTIPVELAESSLSIGEPLIKTTEENKTSPGGIPGFPSISIVIGIIMVLTLARRNQKFLFK